MFLLNFQPLLKYMITNTFLLKIIMRKQTIWHFFLLTSSSVHSGLCSATTTILSSLRTLTENIAILQQRNHGVQSMYICSNILQASMAYSKIQCSFSHNFPMLWYNVSTITDTLLKQSLACTTFNWNLLGSIAKFCLDKLWQN